jgi:hypothetical protein
VNLNPPPIPHVSIIHEQTVIDFILNLIKERL